MGPANCHESVMESSIDGSNAVVATAIAQPITTAIVLSLEPLIGFAVLIRWPGLTPSATPTAAPAADQPTILSSPLSLPSLAMPERYVPVHIFDTTSTSYPHLISNTTLPRA
jgi:hypothetical protein